MHINTKIEDACVFSLSKDMGVFKSVGYPEDVVEYFFLDKLYKGYIWTAHGRFPTNTQSWWRGAHPLCILDWTVVHNGEISFYGANRCYLEMHGYYCTLHTDTEVMTYAVDLLMRKQHLPISLVARIFAPPVWELIERMNEKERKLLIALWMVYAPMLINGPFGVIVAHHDEMIGLTDRIRLRPLTAGIKGGKKDAMKPYILPEFIIERNEEKCIRCRVCERQCAFDTHCYEEELDKMFSDEEKCVGCQRCVVFCPANALVVGFHPSL